MLEARSWRTRWVKQNRCLYGSICPPFGRSLRTGRRLKLEFHGGKITRTLALPDEVEHGSLTTLREKLVKIGAKVVRHGRYVTFQFAEVAVPRDSFRKILRLIDDRRPRPAPA